jgi:hypothetical protein
MRRIIFSLLVLLSLNSYADEVELPPEESLDPVEIVQPIEIVEKDNKIGYCVHDYVKKQSRSYAKIAQGNLYDLIHNFTKISKKIYGKKPIEDNVAHDEKLEALAKIQCEAYYEIGVLK